MFLSTINVNTKTYDLHVMGHARSVHSTNGRITSGGEYSYMSWSPGFFQLNVIHNVIIKIVPQFTSRENIQVNSQ